MMTSRRLLIRTIAYCVIPPTTVLTLNNQTNLSGGRSYSDKASGSGQYWGGDYGKWFYDYFVSTPQLANTIDDNIHFRSHMTGDGDKKRNLMSWPSHIRGLEQRVVDATESGPKLRSLIAEAQAAMRAKEEKTKVDLITKQIAEIVYGKGESAETRQRYVEKYGCAAYTDEALRLIVATTSTSVSNTTARRGIVEMGAGNGQWARQLADRYKLDIIAFDNMASVPLRREQKGAPGAPALSKEVTDQSFFTPIHEGSETVLTNWQRITQFGLQDRVLMIIFPDPSKMAVRTLDNYVSLVEKKGEHDAVLVYVGEGRGGANAEEDFFDRLEKEEGGWKLESTCALAPFGDKGFERLFVFRKRKQ